MGTGGGIDGTTIGGGAGGIENPGPGKGGKSCWVLRWVPLRRLMLSPTLELLAAREMTPTMVQSMARLGTIC